MRISNNLSALTAFNSLTRVNNQIDKTIQQLSTGLRINSAADDAAGLAVSENLRAQLSGLDRALKNSQDGISLIQTAEGALGETNSMLQRMRELAVQAANDTLTAQDRSYIQMEIDELKAHIDRIANTTQFNGRNILDGSVCGTITTTDPAVKGYVRGALETEGNFRIEVKANPGEAQVQKSSIMRIKHENVVTNSQLNSADGFGALSIDGLPAGDYSISTSMGAGSESVSYIYKSTLTGQVTELDGGATIPADETMTIKYTLEDGKTGDLLSFDLAAGLDQNATAQAIVNAINNKGSVTINGNEIKLEASLNSDGVSYTVKTNGKEHITGISGTTSLKSLDRVESTEDNSKRVPFDIISVEKDAVASGTIYFYDRVYESAVPQPPQGATPLGSVTVTAPCTASTIASDIANELTNNMGYSHAFVTTFVTDLGTTGAKVWVDKDGQAGFYIWGGRWRKLV